jgi:DNA-binding MarR family transcriptional regulator
VANAGTREKAKHTPTMLEFLVMAAVRKSSGEFVDMLTVAQALRHRAQIDLPPTNLYGIMHRLEKAGLVFETRESRQRGESRHFYTITDAGHAYLTQWTGRLLAML